MLVNLAEEPEYCEKLMYARSGMVTPSHCHKRKKEDIICRWGILSVRVWHQHPRAASAEAFTITVNGKHQLLHDGETINLTAGWRVTLTPGVYHEFVPASDECIIGEVSTANDDQSDNLFENPDVGRFPQLIEDMPPLVRLLSDKSS